MPVCPKLVGTVKFFNNTKGFGFITPDDGTDDLFVHQSSVYASGYRSLADGEAVEFDVETGEDGRTKAVNVTGPNGVYVKGAPRESSRDNGGYGGGGGGGGGYGGGNGGGYGGGRSRGGDNW